MRLAWTRLIFRKEVKQQELSCGRALAWVHSQHSFEDRLEVTYDCVIDLKTTLLLRRRLRCPVCEVIW